MSIYPKALHGRLNEDGDPVAACVVCGKETDWTRKRYCREHAAECKHERAGDSTVGLDVCNDCGATW